MLTVLELDVADLAATRFAISPLGETLRAVALLGLASPPAVNRPWVRWARQELDRRPLRLARLWPLVVTDRPTWPEFLLPAPAGKSPSLDAELARLCATPDEAVRASLRRGFGALGPGSSLSGSSLSGSSPSGSWPQTATELFDRPRESLAEIAAELAEGHDRLIAPHWERLRSVLDADIAYRAGLLAGGGARSLFGDLHPGLRWSAGKLFMSDAEQGTGWRVTLGPDGLVLMPSVFIWPDWSVKRMTSTQTTLFYPARGTGSVWDEADLRLPDRARDLEAVEALLGTPRARLLGALRSPATTSALARRLGVTPSAVSQHLAVLHRGGLVDRQRSGRTVLYQASVLGLAVLGRAGPGEVAGAKASS
jgi:DNA-binding transcriptional ArsR family regulator